ncbi:hypothetical protein P7F88_21685 [Vibrio hannami]|uniref:NADH-quinone oxidoreductase subunit B family protein n=1 Tax=Vibrio hannami TaxID=2717094 RepID=UPI00240EFFF1|nr:hypothetical protein [Vibrio hannami]MDG3088534.1 hypothetical protein [Vibrio hannami]
MSKLTISIHKFTSCSGCQLGFVNLGEALLTLLDYIEITHFVEGGIYCPDCTTDIAFVEGSITTKEDIERLKLVRDNSQILVTIGACATSGGVQALRNLTQVYGEVSAVKQQVYASPQFIEALGRSEPVAKFVKVDYEIWGCPVSGEQVLGFLSQILTFFRYNRGGNIAPEKEKLCLECKRRGNVCVLITKQSPCLGAVTRTGCGAICPSYGKACYSCYGPSEQPNCRGLANRLQGIGLLEKEIVDRFAQFHSNGSEFNQEIEYWLNQGQEGGQHEQNS